MDDGEQTQKLLGAIDRLEDELAKYFRDIPVPMAIRSSTDNLEKVLEELGFSRIRGL